MKRLRHLFLAALLALAGLFVPAIADAPATTTTSVQAVTATPAYWRIRGRRGTVYLLGSVHLLPPSTVWRTDGLDQAIKKADIFVFEAAADSPDTQKEMDAVIREKGRLPPGTSLRALLSPEGQADIDAVTKMVGTPEAMYDGFRPWLADLLLSVTLSMKQSGATPFAGVDFVLSTEARKNGREIRYFETAKQQLDLLSGGATLEQEVAAFQIDLREMRDQPKILPDMLEAWSRGDVDALQRMFDTTLDTNPEARAALLDNRNAAWVVALKPWLDMERKTFFVTVGAGHLVGPGGVPALLKKEGYRVEGPLH